MTQACNDKEQVLPMLERLPCYPPHQGYRRHSWRIRIYGGKNAAACETHGIEPFITKKRDEHHPSNLMRFTEPAVLPTNAMPPLAMAQKLKTKAGQACYALRKQTVEPLFGIIKSVRGFHQFSLRGLKNLTGEWALVCFAWNLKRMAVLRPQQQKQWINVYLQARIRKFKPCKPNPFYLIESGPTVC